MQQAYQEHSHHDIEFTLLPGMRTPILCIASCGQVIAWTESGQQTSTSHKYPDEDNAWLVDGVFGSPSGPQQVHVTSRTNLILRVQLLHYRRSQLEPCRRLESPRSSQDLAARPKRHDPCLKLNVIQFVVNFEHFEFDECEGYQ